MEHLAEHPVYLPYASDGENHIEDHLGMHGIPFEPVPDFPTNAENVFLTQAALKDPDILQKLEAFLRNGGTAVVTTGFCLSYSNSTMGAV